MHIEAELRCYHDSMIELESLKKGVDENGKMYYQSPLNASPLPPDGMPRGSDVSDPTSHRATALEECQHINYLSRVTYAIGNIVWKLPPEKLKLVELTYWTKPQTLTSTGLAIKLNCGRKTYFNWRDEICEAIARGLGML